MQDFDRALKELFQSFGGGLTGRFAGARPREWLNVEMAQTMAPRADLVAWLEDGALFHLEFQSGNDPLMGTRMLEYFTSLLKRYGQPPRQTVLYVGSETMRMPAGLDYPQLRYSYQLADAAALDAEELLSSSDPGENALAILCRVPEPGIRVRRVVERLGRLEGESRKKALRLLLLLSVLRDLAGPVVEEVRHMSLQIDPLRDPYLRELYQQVLEEGIEKGRVQLLAKIVLELLEERFQPLPEWARETVMAANEEQLWEWKARTRQARSLEELLGRPH
jgi:hypothetical protein